MLRSISIGALSLVLLSGTLAATAAAQGGDLDTSPGRFSPPSGKPTISPYLDLFNRNNGPIPNYYTYVRPKLDQQRTNAATGQQIGRNMLRIDQNAAQIGQVEGQLLQSKKQGVSPTGSRPASFMNSSHFFPSSLQP